MNKAFFAAVLLSFGIAQALAGGADDPRQVSVRVSDLDLQSAEGQRALKRRLTKAAQSLCTDRFENDLDTRMADARCVKTAVNHAMAVLGEGQLARTSGVNGNRG